MLDIAAACIVITALLAFVNHRFIGLPTTIGVMSIALVLSLAFIGLDRLGIHRFGAYEDRLLASIDFSDLLMQGMLSLLLFAAALHVDLSELHAYRWHIALLAVLGTCVSAALIGAAAWYVLPWLGVHLSLGYCVVFGALISPTDPIAVMGILKTAGAPKGVEVVISGESLFNDGVGIVLFVLAVSMLGSGAVPTAAAVGELLLREAGGGIAFGLALGYVTYLLLRNIDSYQEEVLITLAAVTGGYALASRLHISGPLAMVVVGLIIGNHARASAMSKVTRVHLDMFWELVDAILNSVLFVLIGFEITVLEFSAATIVPAVAMILVALGARYIIVSLPFRLFRGAFGLPRGSWKILTWGGLRGGISVALALSLPMGAEKDIVVTFTYVIVIFSILVQGLTIGSVIKRTIPCAPAMRRDTQRSSSA
ncbi:MAG TPA: sodium:proton antiporter [Steroidobacteraceae bacterium]|nr:sodium:proton antiporter [Steroidobacteraceae bacterium]